MKVLHLVQRPQLRGAELSASRMASHLLHNGHEAVLVSLFPGNADLHFEGRTVHLRSSFKHRFWNIRAWRKLAEIIKKEEPDIIQANAGFTMKFAVLSKIFFRWKQPIVLRNASTISQYIRSKRAKIFNRIFFRYASRIVSVSKLSALDFAGMYPEFHKRLTVVPVGIEAAGLLMKDENSHDQLTLIHVGGFTFEKNHTGLLRIYKQFFNLHRNSRLLLVGDGPLRKSIEQEVQRMGLADNVLFMGAREDVMQLISRSDVLVLPSIIEGLPSVILESFYCKVPVVAYDTGGIREILMNEGTGRLVPAGDESAFVAAIEAAIESTAENKEMTENAWQMVNDSFLNQTIATKFENVYRSILEPANRRSPVHELN